MKQLNQSLEKITELTGMNVPEIAVYCGKKGIKNVNDLLIPHKLNVFKGRLKEEAEQLESIRGQINNAFCQENIDRGLKCISDRDNEANQLLCAFMDGEMPVEDLPEIRERMEALLEGKCHEKRLDSKI